MEADGCEVGAPLDLGDGFTIGHLQREHRPTYYAVYSRLTGRMRDELTLPQCEALGEVIGRMHHVGRTIDMNVCRRPKDQLEALSTWIETDVSLPSSYRSRAERWRDRIAASGLSDTTQLIHGDLHLGNIIWDGDTPFLIDFDDCGLGWTGQDLWLIAPSKRTSP